MRRLLSLRSGSLALTGSVMLAAALVLVVGISLLDSIQALDFNHVSGDKDGDHLVDASDPQPNVYCGFAHADVGSDGFGELDGIVSLTVDIAGVIAAYGTASPLHDQNHNDIVDLLDVTLVIDHYAPFGYDCSGATPDPTPVSGLGTSGPNIVHDGPGSLTGDEGSITVTVSTSGVATDPYRGYQILLRFNTGVVQGTDGTDSGIFGEPLPCGAGFTNSGEGLAKAFVPCTDQSLAVTNVGPLVAFTFDVIAAGDPGFSLVCFGGPDNAGAFGGTFTIGTDVAAQLQTVQGCNPPPTPTPTPPPVPTETVSTTIGSGGGTLSTGSGDSVEVVLDVPSGALPGDVEITIDVYNIWEMPAPTGDGVFLSRAFLFEPDGLQFSTPATVVISYDESEVAGIDEATMDVLVYDSQADDWSIDNVIARDTTANTLTIAITHFSGRVSTERDADGDGCPNEYEERDDEMIGGLRDMLNENDYYDVAISGGAPGQDQYIDLFNDIASVIDHYAPSGEVPPYDENYDRGPSAGPFEWNMTGPDGVIDLFNDIVGVIAQAGHDCR